MPRWIVCILLMSLGCAAAPPTGNWVGEWHEGASSGLVFAWFEPASDEAKDIQATLWFSTDFNPPAGWEPGEPLTPAPCSFTWEGAMDRSALAPHPYSGTRRDASGRIRVTLTPFRPHEFAGELDDVDEASCLPSRVHFNLEEHEP